MKHQQRSGVWAGLVMLLASVQAQELRPGQICLIGQIEKVEAGAQRLVLRVHRFLVPPQKENKLPEPRPRTVVLTTRTILEWRDKPGERLPFDQLKSGLWAAATGPDKGAGSDLTAETIVVWTEGGEAPQPKDADKAPPAKTPLEAAAAGDWDAAIKDVTAAVTADWKREEAWRALTDVLREARKQERDDAEKRTETPLSRTAGEDARRQHRVGMALLKSGFTAQALALYDELVRKDPLNALAWAGLAEARLGRGEYEAAQAAADRSVAANGNCAEGHLARAKALVARGMGQAAMEALTRATALPPNRPEILGVRAQVQLLLDNAAAAEDLVGTALKADAEEPEALFAAGLLQERRGEGRPAQTTWKKYLRGDPVSQRAERVRLGCVFVRVEKVQAGAGGHADPCFSPDGKRLVFYFNGRLYMKNSDNSGEAQLLTDGPDYYRFPTWSSDGSQIAYDVGVAVAADKMKWRVDLKNLNTGAVKTVSAEQMEAWRPKFSPDGKKLLMWDAREGSRGLLLVTLADGAEERVLTTRGLFSWYGNWLSDGKRVVLPHNVKWQPYLVRNARLIPLERPESVCEKSPFVLN